jgi:hypothetical protein
MLNGGFIFHFFGSNPAITNLDPKLFWRIESTTVTWILESESVWTLDR